MMTKFPSYSTRSLRTASPARGLRSLLLARACASTSVTSGAQLISGPPAFGRRLTHAIAFGRSAIDSILNRISRPLHLLVPSRTMSTASDSSNGSTTGPPMLEKDAKIIFMNVADIAMFSDMFTERLEEALGSVLEGGTGEDHVGALFLEMVR